MPPGSRFNLDQWLREHAPEPEIIRKHSGLPIDCALTLACTLMAREQAEREGVRFTDPNPCEIAVYAFGQPDSSCCTHISGCAWIPEGENWPILPHGQPANFLGQLYFGDSIDIYEEPLPGLAVQIFCESDYDGTPSYGGESDIMLLWRSETQLARGRWVSPPEGKPLGAPLHTKLARTVDFGGFDAPRGYEGDDAEYLCALEGTKIGGHAVWIQTTDDDHPADDTFIGSIGSMFMQQGSTTDVFVNRPNLSIDELVLAGGENTLGDMGLLNLMRRPDGSFYTVFECR